MSRFSVDGDNELVREGGAFVRVSGAEEVRQDAQVSVQHIRGENPFNLRMGLPWVGRNGADGLLGKGTPPESLVARVQRFLEGRPGITSVTSIELTDLGDRRVRIDYAAQGNAEDLAAALVSDTVTVQG